MSNFDAKLKEMLFQMVGCFEWHEQCLKNDQKPKK
jgi:hypothetical protein